MTERQRTVRGFVIYDEFKDTYTTTVRVQESSAVYSHCWLYVESEPVAEPQERTGQRVTLAIHLAPSGVARLIRALGDYLQDHAEREEAAEEAAEEAGETDG
jgi:hypothetical protein